MYLLKDKTTFFFIQTGHALNMHVPPSEPYNHTNSRRLHAKLITRVLARTIKFEIHLDYKPSSGN